ncbi:glycine receptor subunit alphaZ1-like [Ptychodera flava]|uniref:glycine receptor subunit alphaZ1-like n=1 Tax=Ptychodera flava TaxID=63121 RepID=UPI003969E184
MYIPGDMTFVLFAFTIVVPCLADEMEFQKSATVSPTQQNPVTMISNLLNSSTYDKALRPNFHGPPVHVTCSIRINNFQTSSDTTMDYTVNMFFRTRWVDPRLSYYDPKNHSVAYGADGVNKMWLPPLFFPDEKEASFHVITTENTLLRIHPDGTVLHSTRLTLTLACLMSLQRYPMDEQTCGIDLESFSYTTEDLVLHWAPVDDIMNALEVSDELKLPQFELTGAQVIRSECVRRYSTGNFSCLLARFHMRRQREMFVMGSYVPSLLIVVLSWFSFWINPNSEPARVSLCMTALLTISTQMNGIQAALPKVANLKAIDVWMSVCLIFVFAALVEYAVVNYLTLKAKRSKPAQSETEQHSNQPMEMKLINHSANGPNASDVMISGTADPTDEYDETEDKTNNRVLKWKILFVDLSKLSRPELIDYISRFIFPLAFLGFNMLYWPTYISWLD